MRIYRLTGSQTCAKTRDLFGIFEPVSLGRVTVARSFEGNNRIRWKGPYDSYAQLVSVSPKLQHVRVCEG
eukprot:8059174-Pyramimonas_sp.AAC.1